VSGPKDQTQSDQHYPVAASKSQQKRYRAQRGKPTEPDTEPNWGATCDVCGQSPTVGSLGLCGPCCFGEADTAGGNW
jgi:hypothetical protein